MKKEKSYPEQLIVVERHEGNEPWHSVHRTMDEVLTDIDRVGSKMIVGVYELKELREISAELKQKVIKTKGK